MRPELARFFAGMSALLREPADASALTRDFPSEPISPARAALYQGFVAGHVRDTLAKLYPHTRALLGETRWERAREAYARGRPARHFEINHLGEAFPAFLADLTEAEGHPPCVPAVARFEWTDFAVATSPLEETPPASGHGVNPTLVLLEQPWRLTDFLRARGKDGPPAPGQERVLVWRHPVSRRTMFQGASDETLLALKMALEGLTPAMVSEATGLGRERLEALLEESVASGLLLAARE